MEIGSNHLSLSTIRFPSGVMSVTSKPEVTEPGLLLRFPRVNWQCWKQTGSQELNNKLKSTRTFDMASHKSNLKTAFSGFLYNAASVQALVGRDNGDPHLYSFKTTRKRIVCHFSRKLIIFFWNEAASQLAEGLWSKYIGDSSSCPQCNIYSFLVRGYPHHTFVSVWKMMFKQRTNVKKCQGEQDNLPLLLRGYNLSHKLNYRCPQFQLQMQWEAERCQ